MLSTIIVNLLYFSCRDALLELPWSYTLINFNAKNQLQLVRKDGKKLEVDLEENTVVTTYLAVLNFQRRVATFIQRILPLNIFIFTDTVNADDCRQLRVWLRWYKLGVSKI